MRGPPEHRLRRRHRDAFGLCIPGTILFARCFCPRETLRVTRPEYYIKRAAECLLASEQIPSDRDALLHMAATYVRMAIEWELHRPSGPEMTRPGVKHHVVH
jgi:hypothetical protein